MKNKQFKKEQAEEKIESFGRRIEPDRINWSLNHLEIQAKQDKEQAAALIYKVSFNGHNMLMTPTLITAKVNEQGKADFALMDLSNDRALAHTYGGKTDTDSYILPRDNIEKEMSTKHYRFLSDKEKKLFMEQAHNSNTTLVDADILDDLIEKKSSMEKIKTNKLGKS